MKRIIFMAALLALACEPEELKSIETDEVLVLDENFDLDDYESIKVNNRLEIRCLGETCQGWDFTGIYVYASSILVESDMLCSKMWELIDRMEDETGRWVEKNIYDCTYYESSF